MASLPTLECRRVEFGPLSADPSIFPWCDLQSACLRLAVTGGPPAQATRVWTAWDASDLRVLWWAEDTYPWATLTERDAPLYTEEVVEIFLDPVGDGESYFEIEVNPNNAVLDACMRRIRSGYRKDFRWRCEGLRTSVRRVSDGWMVEAAIPFLSLTCELPRAGDLWRMNLTRIDRPIGLPRELSAWSPTGLAQFHVPAKFGVLAFLG